MQPFSHKLLFSTVIIALISPVSLMATALQASDLKSPNIRSSNIKSLVIKTQAIPQTVTLDARLEAINQSTISAQTSGIVESIKVDINDRVKAGQTLVIINDSQQKAGLSQAQANLAQAQARNEDAQILLKRNRSLFAKKTLSQGELDSSIAQAKSAAAGVLAASAAVDQAKEQLTYTHIKAPYAGIVSQRMVEVGELVSPGQALMSGFAAEPLRAVTRIPQHLAQTLSPTIDPQYVTVKAHGKSYAINSFTLFPYADSRYNSVQARMTLATATEKTQLLPGSWVQVSLPIASKKTLLVPESAILQQGEVASLYIVNQTTGQVKLRYVRLGAKVDDSQSSMTQHEVLSGLTSGESIAINAKAAAASITAMEQ